MKAKHFLIVSVMALAGFVAACSDNNQQGAGGGPGGGAPKGGQGGPGGARPPASVGVITLQKASLPVTTILPGRVEAFQTVDIRPQVSGIIRQVAFKDGGEVKKGELLYQIEDAPYQAALEQAKATLSKAQASLPAAQSNLERYQRLVNSGATQIEYETAKTTVAQIQADIEAARAAASAAEINLGYTQIKAPFDGVIDQTAFNVGNVVNANQTTALTTVRQLDPIYVSLTESSTNLLRLRDTMARGDMKNTKNNVSFRLLLENSIDYNQRGTLDMSRMTVSETTGTFVIRVLFPNPDRILLPGMYVRASLELESETGYALPQLATSRNANGALTAQFISKDGTVETRVFENAKPSNHSWLVTTGVADGDQLIVSGLQSIGPGAPVTPMPVTINDNGVVIDTPPQASPKSKPADAP